jgi:hypothetical protein
VTTPLVALSVAIDTAKIVPEALYFAGYDRLVVDGSFTPDPLASDSLREEHAVAGSAPGQRVVASPAVRIFRLQEPRRARLDAWLQTAEASLAPDVRYGGQAPVRAGGAAGCARGADAEDGGCWVRARASRLLLDAPSIATLSATSGVVTLLGELQSPWPDQRCWLEAATWRSPDLCEGRPAGAWVPVQTHVPMAALRADNALTLHVREVHRLAGDRADSRPARAGLLVRALQLR